MMAMWADHGHWFPFPWIFFAVLIGFLIFRVVMYRRYGGPWNRGANQGRLDAESVLQRRLASGEIDEAEYERIREILRK
jgi:uncharacterized membrane protein